MGEWVGFMVSESAVAKLGFRYDLRDEIYTRGEKISFCPPMGSV